MRSEGAGPKVFQSSPDSSRSSAGCSGQLTQVLATTLPRHNEWLLVAKISCSSRKLLLVMFAVTAKRKETNTLSLLGQARTAMQAFTYTELRLYVHP